MTGSSADVGPRLDRYRDTLIGEFRRLVIDPLGEGAKEFLLSDESRYPHPLSRDQQLVVDLFWGSVEIWDCLEALGDTERYVSRSLPSSFGIPKSRHLHHCIVSHMNKLYIMQERLKAFTAKLRRKYREDAAENLAAIGTVVGAAIERLSGATGSRGEHVHRLRFRDGDLHWLAGFELLSDAKLDDSQRDLLVAVSRRHHKKQRDKWMELVRRNNEAMEQILEKYFSALHYVVFRPDGRLRRPAHWPVT